MKKITFYGLLASPILYLYSYYLISNYVFGDQIIYRELYESFSGASFLEVPFVAERHISAFDSLSFYLLWIGAALGIDKDVYIALANTLLLLALYVLARRHSVNYSMIALLMCNYYVIVLMTGAERLKFAFIFLFLAALMRKKKWNIFFALLSVFAHLQSLILLTSLALNQYKNIIWNLLRGNLRRSRISSVVGALVLGLVLFYSKLDAIGEKYNYYSQSGTFLESVQIILFMLAGLLFIKNKFGFFISLLSLMMLTLFIGGNRVNMIAVFVGVYLFWIEGKGNHPFLYVTMIYFAYKSLSFVSNILSYGNGFYGV